MTSRSEFRRVLALFPDAQQCVNCSRAAMPGHSRCVPCEDQQVEWERKRFNTVNFRRCRRCRQEGHNSLTCLGRKAWHRMMEVVNASSHDSSQNQLLGR